MSEVKSVCAYGYDGCTNATDQVWQYWGGDSLVPKSYPCCANCLAIRADKQKDIDERYDSIKPFTGMNEWGEYYDEDSY